MVISLLRTGQANLCVPVLQGNMRLCSDRRPAVRHEDATGLAAYFDILEGSARGGMALA